MITHILIGLTQAFIIWAPLSLVYFGSGTPWQALPLGRGYLYQAQKFQGFRKGICYEQIILNLKLLKFSRHGTNNFLHKKRTRLIHEYLQAIQYLKNEDLKMDESLTIIN